MVNLILTTAISTAWIIKTLFTWF